MRHEQRPRPDHQKYDYPPPHSPPLPSHPFRRDESDTHEEENDDEGDDAGRDTDTIRSIGRGLSQIHGSILHGDDSGSVDLPPAEIVLVPIGE